MTVAEDILRAKTISIIRSRPCLDIAFTIAGMTLMGYGYGYVADMLQDGVIGVAIGPTGGFDASYDSSANLITFSSPDPAKIATPSGRGTVVHECSHAVVDAVAKGKSVAYGDDEVAAYIAQTVYSINAGDSFNKVGPVAGPLYAIATKIIANKTKKDSPVYVVDPADYVAVRGVILQIYTAVATSQGKRVPQSTVMTGIP